MVLSRRCLGRGLGAFGLALALGGCSAFDSDEQVACPPIAILPDAAQLVRYAGGTDLTDILFEIDIQQASPVCERTETEMVIDMAIVLTARRGPALPEGRAEFSYFVAVTSAAGQLLARQDFPVAIPLAAQGRRVRLTELVQPRIPLTEQQSQFSYRLFIGLALTPEELRRNRGG